ncbi:M23 family metallopeptidase [Schaalia sp. ZJ1691]|uniref:M23 family metallopeptidase n=1 Tax=Schaalia sp. ZJ1691 TaxID=2709404 RepID=UPI001F1560E1|nr:M23 family metallopeptidase [Schaalia sp. ZJ1691]
MMFAFTVPGATASPMTHSNESSSRPWSWPTGHPVSVIRSFDPPAHDWLPGHRGVDLDVAQGAIIRAPADGVVSFSGIVVNRGVVSVRHGAITSTFEPVTPLVHQGQHVVRGDVLARLEAGHIPGGLHWGAKTGKKTYVDPLRLLIGDIVLKPWDG